MARSTSSREVWGTSAITCSVAGFTTLVTVVLSSGSCELSRAPGLAPLGMTPRRLDQGHKETAVSAVLLWVPLDADGEPGAEHLHRLHAAVVREPHGPQPAAELVDSLVVMAKTLGLGPEKGGDGAAGLEDDQVGAGLAKCRPVRFVAQDLGEVLMKGAPEADVEQLQAPADGKQGHVLFQCALAERHFPRVPVLPGRVSLMVRARPVQARVNVGTASEDQAVHGFEHVCRAGAKRRQQYRAPPGPRHRLHIAVWQEGTVLVPGPVARPFHVGGKTNQRRRQGRLFRGAQNPEPVPSR